MLLFKRYFLLKKSFFKQQTAGRDYQGYYRVAFFISFFYLILNLCFEIQFSF